MAVVPVADVAIRISVDDPELVCTYVAIVPFASTSAPGTPPRLFETTVLLPYVP